MITFYYISEIWSIDFNTHFSYFLLLLFHRSSIFLLFILVSLYYWKIPSHVLCWPFSHIYLEILCYVNSCTILPIYKWRSISDLHKCNPHILIVRGPFPKPSQFFLGINLPNPIIVGLSKSEAKRRSVVTHFSEWLFPPVFQFYISHPLFLPPEKLSWKMLQKICLFLKCSWGNWRFKAGGNKTYKLNQYESWFFSVFLFYLISYALNFWDFASIYWSNPLGFPLGSAL